MDNPFTPPARRKNESPVPKNTFQHELDAKMRDRRRKGLSAEISDDELPSDDGMDTWSSVSCSCIVHCFCLIKHTLQLVKFSLRSAVLNRNL